MNNAKDGVVYFSLGSVVPSHLMPDDVKETFIKVFSKLKQRVLWKIDADTLPGNSSNVKIVKWLPQHEILGEYVIVLDNILFVLLILLNMK